MFRTVVSFSFMASSTRSLDSTIDIICRPRRH